MSWCFSFSTWWSQLVGDCFFPISVVEGKWFLWGKEWWKVYRTPIWNTRVGFSIGKLSISSEVTADSLIYIYCVLFYWYWSYFFDFYYSFNSCCYCLIFSGGCKSYNRLLQRRERNFCGKTPFSQYRNPYFLFICLKGEGEVGPYMLVEIYIFCVFPLFSWKTWNSIITNLKFVNKYKLNDSIVSFCMILAVVNWWLGVLHN